MREIRRIRGGNARNGMGIRLRGIWVEMQKNVGNKGGDAGNQGGNLSIAVEMT